MQAYNSWELLDVDSAREKMTLYVIWQLAFGLLLFVECRVVLRIQTNARMPVSVCMFVCVCVFVCGHRYARQGSVFELDTCRWFTVE